MINETEYLVKISNSKTVVFPIRCISCNHPDAGEVFTYTTPVLGIRGFLRFAKSEYHFDIPVCGTCLKRQKQIKWTEIILSSLVFCAGFLVAPLILSAIDLPTNKLTKLLIAALFVVPLIIVSSLVSRNFEILCTNTEFIFYFKKKEYAEDFANLNFAEVTIEDSENL